MKYRTPDFKQKWHRYNHHIIPTKLHDWPALPQMKVGYPFNNSNMVPFYAKAARKFAQVTILTLERPTAEIYAAAFTPKWEL